MPVKKNIEISSVKDFLDIVFRTQLCERGNDSSSFFYRGHSNHKWELIPAILRKSSFTEKEDELVRSFYAYNPSEFSNCMSTFDLLVKMRHYGLPTRLLDITRNPLVALYFACEYDKPNVSREGDINERRKDVKEEEEDGSVYIFSIPNSSIKHYESDSVSIISNIAKCRDKDMEINLYPTQEKVEGTFYIGWYDPYPPKKHLANQMSYYVNMMFSKMRVARYNRPGWRSLKKIMENLESVATEYMGIRVRENSPIKNKLDELKECISKEKDSTEIIISEFKEELLTIHNRKIPIPNLKKKQKDICQEKYRNTPTDSYKEWFNESCLGYLLHQIGSEKPHFNPIIEPYDLGKIIAVKAKYNNQRIINQQGAFFLFGLGLDWGKNGELKDKSS